MKHLIIRLHDDGRFEVQFPPDFERADAERAVAQIVHVFSHANTPGPHDGLRSAVKSLFVAECGE